jgi:hypothetical protein
MIGLLDFLKAAGIELNHGSYKVHLACQSADSHPLDVYCAGYFKEWQDYQNKKNFQCDMILSLIDMGQNNWLFAGIYKVLGVGWAEDHWRYETELLPGQDQLTGRIVVQHKRGGRASYLWPKPTGMEFPIAELRRERLTIEDFPGYNAIVLSHSKFRIITEQKIASWHGALANIKGVYLITDTKTGKHYVGSARGTDGIWQRWCSYADNGHGGNRELKELLQQEGAEYKTKFQYSVLEIADTHASDQNILARESYWKSALRSRECGLNSN